MKKELQELKKQIDDGREGNSYMIPFGFPKISESLAIGKKLYYLIGGMSGTGKTAFTDLAFVLLPYFWYLKNKDKTDIKVRWIYRSMERSKTYKLAKWVALRLFIKYKLLIDVPTILSWNIKRSRISDEVYNYIVQSFDIFEEMLDYVEIIDGSINPTGIYKHVIEYATTVGNNIEEKYITKEGIERRKTVYIPNDVNLITIIVMDFAGKSKGETNEGKFLHEESKELMDKLSSYCSSEFRDRYGFTPVLVSQFNRGLENVQRRINTELHPLPGDFKNTGNFYDHSDIALGLYNPYKLGDLNDLGYDIQGFVNSNGYNRYRSVYVLKNSYGVDDVAYGFTFLGECGYMKELPKANKMTKELYNEIRNIK